MHLSAFLKETQKYVTGTVRVKLFKGHAIVEGRKSDILYMMKNWRHILQMMNLIMHAAVGFINLCGLPTKVNSIVNKTRR